MRNSIWDKRIPSLLGIVLVGVGVLFTAVITQNSTIFTSRADVEKIPEHIQITNVSDTSFTVTYTTSGPIQGTIVFGKDTKMDQLGFDDRDQQTGNPQPYTVHHITAKNLTPNTKYFFAIISGSETYLHDKAPYEITTAPASSVPPTKQLPAVGKLLLQDGSMPAEGLVYLTANGSQTVSALTKPDGSFTIPLNTLRTEDLKTYLNFSDAKTLQATARSATLRSKATLLASQINPIPPITLGNDYDFTVNSTPIPNQEATESASLLPVKSFISEEETAEKKPDILLPKPGDTFNDQQPRFEGTALPNETVDIEIHSDEAIQSSIKSDANGTWSYRPDKPLSPGKHTITITTRDPFGILKTLTREFTVYAQGSQFIEPSVPPTQSTVTPKPTTIPTPTKAPTPPPTAVPTPPPTAAPTPTTAQPTLTPVVINPTSILTPAPLLTQGPIPPTGSAATIVGSISALAIIGIGMLLFFLTKGEPSV